MIDRRERGTGGEGRLRETEENVEVGRGEGRGGGGVVESARAGQEEKGRMALKTGL